MYLNIFAGGLFAHKMTLEDRELLDCIMENMSHPEVLLPSLKFNF